MRSVCRQRCVAALHPVCPEHVRHDDLQKPSACEVRYHEPLEFSASFGYWEQLVSDIVSATHRVGSSSVRRACHEPLWVKTIRIILRTCLDEVRRVEIGKDPLMA